MEWECPPVTTLARSTPPNRTAHGTPPIEAHITQKNSIVTTPVRPRPQHQLINRNANITPLSEAHITQKNKSRPTCGGSRQLVPYPHSNYPNETHAQAVHPKIAPDPAITKQLQPQSSHLDLKEHGTNHPARPRPQHQLTNRNTNITPISEAHITQKNKPRPTCGGIRQLVPCPHSNHPNETHAQAVRQKIAPDSAITTQIQPQSSHLDPMEHGTNQADKGMHTQSTSRHIPARCEPTIQTSKNTKPTINPEIKLPRAVPDGPDISSAGTREN